jgi:hypothetical protein
VTRPHWEGVHSHCTPEQAVHMADEADAHFIMPVHHQTFHLSSEDFREPIERFQAALRYIVPKLGVRLNLADLVVNVPLRQDLFFISAMNHGDMIGSNSSGNFLLQRIDATSSHSFATPVVKNERRAIPPVIAAIQRRLQPQLQQLK